MVDNSSYKIPDVIVCLSHFRLLVSGTDSHSSNGSINLLFYPVRRGSACRQLHPLPTIVQTDLTGADPFKTKKYYKKLSQDLTDEEVAINKQQYEEIIANEFPEEDMIDMAFRDKVSTTSKTSFISFFLGQRIGTQNLDPQCELKFQCQVITIRILGKR